MVEVVVVIVITKIMRYKLKPILNIIFRKIITLCNNTKT